MLRASSESRGDEVAVQGVLAPRESSVGVEHEDLLIAFAESAVRRDDSALAAARHALARELGPEALVDAACIVGNFERMNRIADGCGIALGILEFVADDIRNELDIEHFNSAANTRPTRGVRRVLMKLVARMMIRAMRSTKK